MQDIRAVHGLECSEGLVDEVLAVVVGEVLGTDDSMHICLHQFLVCVSLSPHILCATHLYQVNLGESLVISRFLNVQD